MGWLHCKETSSPIAQSSQTLCFCTTTISPPFQSTHSIISQSGECKYSRATKITELPTMVYALLSYPLHMFWDLQCTCVLVKGLSGSVLIWTCFMISSTVRKVVCFSMIAGTSRTIQSVTTPQIHCPTRPHWLLCKITPSALFKSN